MPKQSNINVEKKTNEKKKLDNAHESSMSLICCWVGGYVSVKLYIGIGYILPSTIRGYYVCWRVSGLDGVLARLPKASWLGNLTRKRGFTIKTTTK